jgi:hypothetical protein
VVFVDELVVCESGSWRVNNRKSTDRGCSTNASCVTCVYRHRHSILAVVGYKWEWEVKYYQVDRKNKFAGLTQKQGLNYSCKFRLGELTTFR